METTLPALGSSLASYFQGWGARFAQPANVLSQTYSNPIFRSPMVTGPPSGGGKRHPGKAILSGGIAGGIEICITYPTEYVKTQMQLFEKMGNMGPIACAKQTVKTDGFTGLYRGLTPLLYFSIPKAAVRFAAFESFKNQLQGDSPKLSMGKTFMAGLGAGVTEAILVVTPMETIKVKLIHDQLTRAPADRMYKGFFHGCKTIIQQNGIAGTYKGLTATIIKQGSNQAIRFVVFGNVRDWMVPPGPDGPARMNPLQSMFAGAVAGAASVFGNTPVDVVKTKMQGLEAHKYRNTWHCVQEVAKNEGLKGFYKGTTPRLGRVCADVAIVMTLYEQVNRVLDMVWKT